MKKEMTIKELKKRLAGLERKELEQLISVLYKNCNYAEFVEKKGEFAYLEPLCTQPKYRGKDIAAAIISEMIRRVSSLGMNAITIIIVFQSMNSILTKDVLRAGGDTRFLKC